MIRPQDSTGPVSGHDGNRFFNVRRMMPFDTSGMGRGATINSATLSVWVSEVWAEAGGALCLVRSHQVSKDKITTADYFMPERPPEFTERVPFADLTVGRHSFTLNAAGLAAINPTGTTFLAFCTSLDLDVVEPPESTRSGVAIELVANPDPDKRPRLDVDYDKP